MTSQRALIVVPTYNEAENVERMVAAIAALDHRFEILVVDDNSPDGTGAIAEELRAQVPGLHVLHRPGKMGLGTAYIEGFRWALERDYDLIFEMDCDFSHDPQDLPRFLDEIRDADLVLGSRYISGGSTPDWQLRRRLISFGGNLIARLLLRLHVRDCTGGFRCYRRELIERIPWDQICVQGYAFQVGAVYYAERMGARIKEFPIVFRDRRVGQSKMSAGIVREALRYVLRLAWSDVIGTGA